MFKGMRLFNRQPYSLLANCIKMSSKAREDLAYVAKKDGTITISFNYRSQIRSKMFNLQRGSSERLAQTMERIQLNLNKLYKQENKKSKRKDTPLEQETITLILNGNKLDPDMTSNNEAWVDGAILQFKDQSFQVVTNCPKVESIKLPACPMSNLVMMPTISLMNSRIEDCTFSWHRLNTRTNQNFGPADEEGIKVSSELAYMPNEDDVNQVLKFTCVPSNETRQGPVYQATSSAIEMGPASCPFERRFAFTGARVSDPHKMRVVTYNILADLYADSDYSRTVLFGHCPTHALSLDYRRQLILKELSGYNADIICLQEVDKKEFTKVYEPYFKLMENCSGVYSPKGDQVAEGVATFVCNDTFEIIESHRTILSELIEPLKQDHSLSQTSDQTTGAISEQDQEESSKVPEHPILNDRESQLAQDLLAKFNHFRDAIVKKESLRERFTKRHTVLQTTLIKNKKLSNEYSIIANTHLYFAPDADHIRLLQGGVCVKYLEYMKEVYYKDLIVKSHGPNNDIKLGLILCGDMNSSPDCGLYQLLTQGYIPEDYSDWSSNTSERVEGLSLSTHLRLLSAYEGLNYTNYTPLFNGCLDYIYFEKDKFHRYSVVPLPDHDEITKIGGIPSDVFPSDHLSLIADLVVCRNDEDCR